MKQKWLLLVNPTSGNGQCRQKWGIINASLAKAGIAFDYKMSEYAGHLIEATQKAIAQGYRKLVAVGGDGTAHEVINGIFSQQEVPQSEITFAIIPVGTGNDWIRTHNIPRNIEKAIALLKEEKTLMHDIGEIDYMGMDDKPQIRYFINVAGLGYDAFVTRASKYGSRWMGSKLFYFWMGLRGLFHYKTAPLRMSYQGTQIEGDIYSAALGLCLFNGGGTQFVPHAIPDDGLFALTYFQGFNAWDMVMISPRLYNGSIAKAKKATTTQVQSLRIEAIGNADILVEADGEFLGKAPMVFSMLPNALRVVVK